VMERHPCLPGQLVGRVLANGEHRQHGERRCRQRSGLTFALDRSIHCSYQEYRREDGMSRVEPVLRVATPEDAQRVDALIKESAAAIFPRYYDQRATASAVRHVAEVDPMLLADGTYFVVETDGDLVACGGWSRRDRLYAGSGGAAGDSRLLDPLTEPARVR